MYRYRLAHDATDEIPYDIAITFITYHLPNQGDIILTPEKNHNVWNMAQYPQISGVFGSHKTSFDIKDVVEHFADGSWIVIDRWFCLADDIWIINIKYEE